MRRRPALRLPLGLCVAVALALVGCAALGPALDALPGVVSAVEAVTAAARAQNRPLDADVLKQAQAIDAAAKAREDARAKLDAASAKTGAALLAASVAERKQLAALLAAVKARPVQPAPCPACAPVVTCPPMVVAPTIDAGVEGGP